ncbi:MAG TPA: immunoglobulin domain-containing protein [Verrucomicrobiae bacterium]|nr:immunoglobulin domain-containing protein [Verrucomicrobiae bacterium]
MTLLAGTAFADTTVLVDSTKPWTGYMNVYDNVAGTEGNYEFGSGWGLGALTAFFDAGSNTVTLLPNTNTYNPADPYWVNGDGSGAKWMEANFYVDAGTAFAGQTVTLTGTVLSNTLVAPYSSVAVIKEFGPGYAFVGQTTADLPGGSFSVSRAIAPGNICQYGFMTTGPDANPATLDSLGKVVLAVNNADPSITPPASLALVEGQTASFTVAAAGTTPISYQWAYVTDTTTNVLANGGRISGATSSTLTLTGVTASDAGNYAVTVANSVGSAYATAGLTVIPLAQASTNLLINSGFEQGPFAQSGNAGWFNFSGAALASTNDYYHFSADQVTVSEGTNCAQVYAGGTYDGFFQDRPALPGQVYTASCDFLTPVDDAISGGNVCYLEVQFHDAAGNALDQYSTALIDDTFPLDTWTTLSPTNIKAGDFTTALGTAPYLVAPPNTASVRYQITYHSVGGSGSVYVDNAALTLREPVVSVNRSGSSVQLSFPTLYGPTYQVYYKNQLSDPLWVPLGSGISGDGTTKVVNDSPTGPRFYTVNTRTVAP